MDDYGVTPQGLLAVFGSDNAHVRHLILALESGDLTIDLHAFPHLEHLAVSVEDMDAAISMLQLNGHASALQSRCSSLAELVVTWKLAVDSTLSSAGGQVVSPRAGPDGGADVDEVFRQKCSVLQGVLTRRASLGNRLTSFVLYIRPASKGEFDGSESGSDGSESGSQHSMDDGLAESDSTVWPSRAVGQSVLRSFRELVDSPVVFKFVDRAGSEICADEA